MFHLWKKIQAQKYSEKTFDAKNFKELKLPAYHHCPFCDYSSRIVSNVRQHILTHTGERPYICTHCGAEDSTLNSKWTPRVLHQCTQCEYISLKLGDMKRHVMTHTGDSSYSYICFELQLLRFEFIIDISNSLKLLTV
ncbi:Transcriptional repressor CTCF like protein [Argiope bruennichi]|uniref:Transcriptional repressor CTCF like protein n=1 Tax=Argiope bruennichi TaxID=94029 RepID=A0A8T0E666_ARGBR|nr:Transcriptional repressor CTCF like protein [Argiope bruennichi]